MQLIDLLYIVIFGTMVFSAVLWLSVYILNRDRIQVDPVASVLPAVTFLIPAYNEENWVGDCIESLLNQNYPSDKLEIIAINDGSTDNTLQKLQEYEDEIEIIDKENTGKASSMNYALQRVETKLVGCLDADSIADRDMVRNMVGYFEQEDVKGVTPAMKVSNPTTWPQKLMWMEFLYNVFLRKLFSIFDSQWVMPGPGSLYDTEYLKELGGWDENTLTEDMEVAFRMFINGAKLKNSTNAYVETHSPGSWKGLLKQRTRWYQGYIENVLSFKQLWLNPKYGNLSIIMIPFNAVYTVVFLFMFAHLFFRMGKGLYEMVHSYLLLGTFMTDFNLTVQYLTVFHIFYGLLGLGGVVMLWLSLKTAEEKLDLWDRKMHYLLFLFLYGMVYSVLWVSAIVATIRGVREW